MEIKYSKDFIKKMRSLDKKYGKNIINSIDGLLKIPPMGDIKPLKGTDDRFRLRIGKYRVIYRIKNDTIFIDDIGSRGDIYK